MKRFEKNDKHVYTRQFFCGWIKSRILWGVVFGLVCTSWLVAQEGYEVKRIRIEGGQSFEKETLMSQMSMYEVGCWDKMTRKKTPYYYHHEFIENDKSRLIRFYQSEGFIATEVHIDTVEVQHSKRQLQLLLQIEENTPYQIEQKYIYMSDTSSHKVSQVHRFLQQKYTLTTPTRFRDVMLVQDVQAIDRYLHEQGYPYAKTTYQLSIDTLQKLVKVTYVPSLGRLATFGEVHIGGQKYTKKDYLSHQILFDVGDVYSPKKIDQTRKAMYRLQQFRIISITPRLNAKTQQPDVPIDIILEEMPRLSTLFGGGYGTEDKWRAFVDLTYRGLFRDASRLNLYLKHSALEPYHISLKLIQPQFLDKQTSITLHPYFKRQIEPGFDTQRLGIDVPIQRTITDDLTGSLSYYYEKVIQNVEDGNYEIPDRESSRYLYDKSGLTLNFIYDSSLPNFSPHRGWKMYVGIKYNGFLFPSDFDYVRFSFDIRKYQQLGSSILSLRGMVGAIYTKKMTNFVPVEDRFYAGGGNSIRGWSRAMLGPIRLSGMPRGGNSVMEMNAELRQHLFWRLDGAVFLDVGNVWKERYHYPLDQLAYATGAGLRIDTPIGPIRFDVGFPLSIENKKPHFFISVGQAF